MQRSHSAPRSAVRSGVLTGLSTAAVSGSAAVAGAILSRRFGHGVKTDGFFAAYAVYIALVLVASALRVVVLPQFARARAAGELGREFGSWCLALAVVLVPAIAVAVAAPHAVADALTSGSRARESAAALLPWLIPAAAAQIYAGVAASALAALDDYGTAAFAYGARGGARRHRHPRVRRAQRHAVRLGTRGERRRVARRPARRPRRAGRGGPSGHRDPPPPARPGRRRLPAVRAPGAVRDRLPVHERPRHR